MKNIFRFVLALLLPVVVIAGCSKREGVTYPVTNTPGTASTSTVTRTSTPPTIIANTATITKTSTASVNTATITPTSTTAVNTPTMTATQTLTTTGTATQTATIIAAMPTVIGGIAQPTVVLGTSARFAVFSAAAITDVPSCLITGDVGLTGSRGSITGLLDGDGQVVGTGPNGAYAIYAFDDAPPTPAMLSQAYIDAVAAYADAVNSSRGTPTSISGDLNGLTLAPGLYESGTSIQISPAGFLYLDGMGDPNAVFVIRSATSITTESTSQVVLEGSAQAKNVFWVAGSAITLGTNSTMNGTLIAGTSISCLNMANLTGRAIIQSAQAGQISLSQNIIVLP